ncbi:hypothetical protein Slin14017_G109490 [Septoria linicola]|nr:hypothetical protein Slin14017_G109490 [Septoria linicola]
MAPKRAAKTKKKEEGILDRAPIPSGYISPGDSPFLKKLPREIRGQIYSLLLIAPYTPSDRARHDKITSHLPTRPGQQEYECERELDFLEQDYMLMPDLAAHNPGMARKRPEAASKIKHLLVIINKPNDLLTDVANIKINLRTIVDTFLECGNKFLTLKIRYSSAFGGEVEAVRDAIEGPLHPGMTVRSPVMIRHAVTGKFHQFDEQEFHTKLFKNIHIIEPLKKLKGVAVQVDIRGDLPQRCIDELTSVLSVNDPGPAGKRALRSKAAAASKKAPSDSLQSFAAEKLAEDPNMDPGMKALYQQLTRTSVKSPAVMSQIFPELYNGSMYPPGYGSEQSTEHVTEQDGTPALPVGGIGVIDGRPVFGPRRPPSMD